MTVQLAADTFSRANQSGWGTASDGTDTWVHSVGASTLAIASNEGTVTGGATSANLMLLGSQTATDAEVLVRFSSSSGNDTQGPVLRATGTTTYYNATINGSTLVVRKDVAGTVTTIASATFTSSAATFYWLRFRVVGSTLYANVWKDGTGEPAGWALTTTDTSITSGGKYGLRTALQSISNTISFDSLTVYQAYNLAEQTKAKFSTQVSLNTRARAQFYTQMRGLVGSVQTKFYTRLVGLTTRVRARFYTRMGLLEQTRAQFLVQMRELVGKSRAKFSIRTSLSSAARSRFFARVPLLSPGRAKFLIKVVAQRVLSVSFAQPKQRITIISTSVKSHINATFSEVAMARPNTTIDVSATVTDANGNPVTNLTVCTVVVLFPDGTQSATLTATNMGAGVYMTTYTTKSPGLHRETWNFTDVSGATAQCMNITPVSF